MLLVDVLLIFNLFLGVGLVERQASRLVGVVGLLGVLEA
jgi:hypothetical protein